MRTEVLFNNVNASLNQASTTYVVDCGQDMRWLLTMKSTGLDGTPKVFIEESPNGVDWIPLNNHSDNLNYWLLDDNLITVRDSYFMGKAFRLRLEANGNTTGTIYADLIVKTKSN